MKIRTVLFAHILAALTVVAIARLVTPAMAQDAMPHLSVAYFDSKEGCPTGWQLLTEADGRFILPTPWQGKPNISKGMAIEYTGTNGGKIPMHSHHTAEADVDVPSRSFVAAKGLNKALGHSGTYFAQLKDGGGIPTGPGGLPLVQFTACVKDAPATTGTIPQGLMAFAATEDCPSEWQPVDTAAGRYIVGLPENGHPGAAYGGAPIEPDEIRTHKHAFAGTFDLPGKSVAAAGGCCGKNYAASGHLSFTGSTYVETDADALDSAVQAPYYTAKLCRKD